MDLSSKRPRRSCDATPNAGAHVRAGHGGFEAPVDLIVSARFWAAAALRRASDTASSSIAVTNPIAGMATCRSATASWMTATACGCSDPKLVVSRFGSLSRWSASTAHGVHRSRNDGAERRRRNGCVPRRAAATSTSARFRCGSSCSRATQPSARCLPPSPSSSTAPT